MRRHTAKTSMIAAVVTIGLAAASSGTARSDGPRVDDSGLFYSIHADVSPPLTTARHRRKGVRFDFSYFTGNIRTGERPASLRSVLIRTPRGFRFNYTAFPSCPRLTPSWQPADCPPGARIGTGSAVADARPFIPELLRVREIAFYNGKLTDGRPALLLFARVLGLNYIFPFEIKPARGRFGPAFLLDFGAEPPAPEAFSAELVAVNVTFADMAPRLGRRRVHLWESAPQCRRSWLVRAVVTARTGRRLGIDDHIPCTTS